MAFPSYIHSVKPLNITTLIAVDINALIKHTNYNNNNVVYLEMIKIVIMCFYLFLLCPYKEISSRCKINKIKSNRRADFFSQVNHYESPRGLPNE